VLRFIRATNRDQKVRSSPFRGFTDPDHNPALNRPLGGQDMPYAFTLTATIPASAQEIYAAWLDSRGHTEMTGGEARMSDALGAEVVAWDGYIKGRNLELVPGKRIVQSWRTKEFTDEHDDSIITVTLEEVAGGTLLTLVHSKVPDAHKSYERGGWQDHYFEPMKKYFAKRAGRKAKAAPPKTKAKSKSKTKRAAARTKPATTKAKTRKKKSKRAVARTKPKRAKKSKRKAVKGKSRR
jgi:uncharacterized protein YndB with AHSA1/START domain